MAKKKAGDYSQSEENKLLKIPYAQGKGEHTQRLKDLAEKMNRPYPALWQKWYALHNKTAKSKPVNAKTDKDRATAIAPMQFADVEFVDTHKRVDLEEETAMQKGLEQAIMGPLVSPKRAILFPARLVNKARQYLVKKHPQSVFSFHTNKKDKKYVLLVKKN